MASGKKNYFRHSFHARKNPKLVQLIDDFGKEAYFHYFALVELCAETASGEFPTDGKFVFRRSTLCHELRVTNSRLSRHLLAIQSALLCKVVVTEKEVEILFPKLSKYMGKYETKLPSNSPNKIKENQNKEKQIKTKPESIILQAENCKRIREAYARSYLERYRELPVWAARENKLTQTLVSRVGIDSAVNLAEKYPSFPDPFHVKQAHPFRLLVSQVEQVRAFLNKPDRILDSYRAEREIRNEVNSRSVESDTERIKREDAEWAERRTTEKLERGY